MYSSSFDQEEQHVVGVIQEFLTSLMTKIPSNDLEHYAYQLCALGFDPDCLETCSELEYDDLRFMKPLHQRYFWKQWEQLLLL